MFTFLYAKLINLNLFPSRIFGSDVDRIRAKRLGQLTTRLYIVLVIISLVIATLYTIIQPQSLTKTFEKPSFDLYNRLLVDYNNSLQCPCSSISSMYKEYVTIQPMFHQVNKVDSRMALENKVSSQVSFQDY